MAKPNYKFQKRQKELAKKKKKEEKRQRKLFKQSEQEEFASDSPGADAPEGGDAGGGE
ncbi:MAG: hypothetical protein H0S80_10010 [Desulfovibrionaceae bacterium]|nr:hypothetical protein [Desulfovibrionaceae bacterium]